MQYIEFNKLRDTSKLFLDFIDGEPKLAERFPNNHTLNDLSYLTKKAQTFENRNSAFDVIGQSMSNLVKSDKQAENISQITQNNTLFVTTGQQAGLFGGPLYTAHKIATAVSSAKKLNARFPSLHFIPLFWLEDNDHDSREAGEVYVFDSGNDYHKISVYSSEDDHKPVSELVFDENIDQLVTDTLDLLPYSQFKNELGAMLGSIYKPGVLWSDATLSFYQHLFGDTGLLFVKASDCRKSGLFGNLVSRNLDSAESVAELNACIERGNSAMNELGFSSNVKSETLSYCLHSGSERYVIKSDALNNHHFSAASKNYSLEELKVFSTEQPDMFSPKVLLRPVFQDWIFPSALTILGPGEINYYSYITEIYEYFGVSMPAIEMRMSASFLTEKQAEFLKANELDVSFFMRDISEIEADLSRLMTDEHSEQQFDKSKEMIENSYNSLRNLLISAEASLERTVDANLYKSLELLDVLKKKYLSAQKKKNFDTFQKYRKLKNFIYANNKLQERSYSPINFINYFGKKKFVNILLDLADNGKKEHIYYINIL